MPASYHGPLAGHHAAGRPAAPGAGAPDRAAGLGTVAGWLASAAAVTVLTGAGVSTDSGIPDYRGPAGLWTRGGQRPIDPARYRTDPAARRDVWRRRRDHPLWRARPNAAHRALLRLQDGRLRALLTQNIDGLHQVAGSDPALLVELHGTLRVATCLDCAARGPMPAVLARLAAGEEDPRCLRCGGVLTSATVGFGQRLDPVLLRRAVDVARDCQVFLAVGSSLRVQPVADLCRVAVAAGAKLVVLNDSPTPYDDIASAVLRGRIGAVLPALLPS